MDCAVRFRDSQQSIVFSQPLAAGDRADFDVVGRDADGQIGQKIVFGLAAAGADDRAIAVFLASRSVRQRLGQRADLIHFDQDGVGDVFVDAAAEQFFVGRKQVVADQLHLVAEPGGELLPAGPIVFGQAVFDARDRKLCDPSTPADR